MDLVRDEQNFRKTLKNSQSKFFWIDCDAYLPNFLNEDQEYVFAQDNIVKGVARYVSGSDKSTDRYMFASDKVLDNGTYDIILNSTQKYIVTINEKILYYIQDSRGYVGNAMNWWRGEGKGYTTNIEDAGKFDEKFAMKQHKVREADIPWLCDYIDQRTKVIVDIQDVDRMTVGDDFGNRQIAKRLMREIMYDYWISRNHPDGPDRYPEDWIARIAKVAGIFYGLNPQCLKYKDVELLCNGEESMVKEKFGKLEGFEALNKELDSYFNDGL